LRKVKFREDEASYRAVEQEIVPLDRRADRAGDYGTPQLGALVDVRKAGRGDFGCCHCVSLPEFERSMPVACPSRRSLRRSGLSSDGTSQSKKKHTAAVPILHLVLTRSAAEASRKP
jgi:hypothetical protein